MADMIERLLKVARAVDAHYSASLDHKPAYVALARDALAQAEPEPVAWQCREHGDGEWVECSKEAYDINSRRYEYRRLYAAPPQRKPLTEDEIEALFKGVDSEDKGRFAIVRGFARAIEAAHGIKGGGNG